MLSAQNLKQFTRIVIARAVLRTPEEDGDTEGHLVQVLALLAQPILITIL